MIYHYHIIDLQQFKYDVPRCHALVLGNGSASWMCPFILFKRFENFSAFIFQICTPSMIWNNCIYYSRWYCHRLLRLFLFMVFLPLWFSCSPFRSHPDPNGEPKSPSPELNSLNTTYPFYQIYPCIGKNGTEYKDIINLRIQHRSYLLWKEVHQGKVNYVGNVLFLKLVGRTWVLLCYCLYCVLIIT